MDRSKRKSYLQDTLKVGGKYIITDLDNKCRFQKKKCQPGFPEIEKSKY